MQKDDIKKIIATSSKRKIEGNPKPAFTHFLQTTLDYLSHRGNPPFLFSTPGNEEK